MPPEHSRWKKGQSGNPGGRPRGQSITARLRAVLEQEHNGRVLLDLFAERIAKEALAGKFPFVKEVLDRLDGKLADGKAQASADVRIVLADLRGLERIATAEDIRELMAPRPQSAIGQRPGGDQ